MDGIELLKVSNLIYKSENNETLNISFSLKKGENVVFFGPEDSGIDIICPIFAGLLRGYSGDILFNGRSLKSLDYVETHNFRKKLGYLQRDFGLISNMTVFENITLPLKYHTNLTTNEIDSIVNYQIQEMKLAHCKDQRPVNLTRSEKLKTAYLRSIALDPELILLEHSLAGICNFNAHAFVRNIKKEYLIKTKSLIFVTYNPKLLIDLADRFIMLYKGNIVFEGTTEEFLLADNQYLQQYFKISTEGPMTLQ